MSRDDQFIERCTRYLALQQDLATAKNDERKAKYKAEKTEEAMKALNKELGEFVGGNTTTKTCVIDMQVVRVCYVADKGNDLHPDGLNLTNKNACRVEIYSLTQPSRK